MRKFYSLVVRNPKKIIGFFLILTVLGAALKVLEGLIEVSNSGEKQ